MDESPTFTRLERQISNGRYTGFSTDLEDRLKRAIDDWPKFYVLNSLLIWPCV